MKIISLTPATEIASLGDKTIKLSLTLENGVESTVALPAGISAGKYEAPTIPAEKAVEEINKIGQIILDGDWTQATLDQELVSLAVAGNSSLAISAAFWKANNSLAKSPYTHFPKLLLLLFEGGKHGSGKISIQEFTLIEESIEAAVSDFKKMADFLKGQGMDNTVGAEGGFSPENFTNTIVLETITAVFPGRDLALDVAGSFKDGEINYADLLTKYRIVSLEDPYSDEEWEKWTALNQKYGDKIMVVGDDLTTTNPTRLLKAIETKAINAIIIKPNQNGTITGTLETAKLARRNNIKTIVSHRGQETDDDWIVDLALFLEADFVKFGGMDRGERVAKYNRLLELGMK